MKKTNLLFIIVMLISNVAFSQVKITGMVNSEEGTPLSGATITEKNNKNAVVSDEKGNYVITVSGQNASLLVSYTGYVTQELAIGNRNVINVTLAFKANLDDVVVVGYGTQKRKDLTGAIATISAEDFAPGANSDARQLLKGTASGVVVTQTSSAPGAGLKIQIRGAGSINSDNGVLFVVDGLPGVDPSSLSPGDIESMAVLKDASASAIYGTRAANGVVLITTKKGKSGKTSLTYSTYYGTQDIPKIIDVLGAADYQRLVNTRLAYRNTPPLFTDAEIAAAGKGTTWQNEIFKTAPIQNHQLSMSGGSAKGTYYLGLNYFKQDGVVLGSENQKYNGRMNIESKPFDKMKISASMNFTRENTQNIQTQSADGGMLSAALRADPTVSASIDTSTGRYYSIGLTGTDNPVALALGVDNRTIFSRIYGTVTTEYEIVKHLTASIRVGGEVNNSRQDVYSSRATMGGLGAGGVASVGAGEFTHWLAEPLVKYQNTFAAKHDFSLLAGATFEEFVQRNLGASTRGFLSDVTRTNLLQSGDGQNGDNVSSSRLKNQLEGFISRATYGFNDKYLLTASLRIDGSSRFAVNNQFAYFPSASVGWVISKEDFLSTAGWLGNLKLRAGYGEIGNQGINNFETRQTLVAGGNSIFGGQVVQGVVAARLPNPDLKWETTKELNLGFDYDILKGRFSGSVDYYNRKTFDQLFVKPLPSVVGFTSVRTNAGDVLNSGVDFSFKSINFDKVFKWNSSLTFSYLDNKVTRLPDFTQQIIDGYAGNFISGYWIVQTGAPLRAFYGYKIDGIFQAGEDISKFATPVPVSAGYKAGMPKFHDENGDGVINALDRVILGSPFPKYTFGLSNSFSYKNLSLDIFINGTSGGKTFDTNISESLYPTNTFTNTLSKYYYDRWTPANPSNTLPSGENYSLYAGGLGVNSLTVVDASYMRLKNVTLGYNVPLKWKSLTNIRLYVSGDDLVTITNFEGYDPESSISGGSLDSRVYNSYPLARTIRFGLDVKF